MTVRTSMSYSLSKIILNSNFINLCSHILFIFCSVNFWVRYNFEVSCVSEDLHVVVHRSYFVSRLGCCPDKLSIVFVYPTNTRHISIFHRNVPDCNPLHLLFTRYRQLRPQLRRPLRAANQLNHLLLRLRLSAVRHILTL
jgi:hypothetical protein